MVADGRSSSRRRPEDGAVSFVLVLIDVDFLWLLLPLLLLFVVPPLVV